MELYRYDLFEAVEVGDIATIERFFAQPHALAAARDVDALITDTAICDLANHAVGEAVLPADAWMYLHDRRTNIFQVTAQHHQYDVMKWLFTSHFANNVQRTLQFFLVDVATAAIREKDAEMLELLLSSRLVFPDTARADLFRVLLRAGIERRSTNVLSVLTAHGAVWNTPLIWGEMPLSEAAAYDLTGDTIHFAAQQGAFIVSETNALHRAAENGNLMAVGALLELGVDPRRVDPEGLETAMHRAAQEGLFEIVDVILETSCVDIDAQNEDGETALNLAIKENAFSDDEDDDDVDEDDNQDVFHPRVVDVLLRHGADTEVSCSSGRTPLRWAVGMQCVGVVRRLLAAGANPNIDFGPALESLHGDTSDKTEAMTALLVKYGATGHGVVSVP